MAHDGQDLDMTQSALISDLLDLTGAALAPVDALVDTATERLRAMVTVEGRVSGGKIEENQPAAHALAWLATYAQSLKQMQGWAEKLQSEGKFGEVEQLIHQIAFGEYLWQIYGGIPMSQGEIIRLQDMGLTQDEMRGLMIPAVMTLCDQGNSQAARLRLVELMQEQAANLTVGGSGLDEELEMIREQFRRYTVEKVLPHAHEWHLKDELIPLEVIQELAEMGVFGLTLPEEYGGFGMSKNSMCVVSEELSRLASHLTQFDALLAQGGAIGRKLEFLIQELLREVNTIGSKASDAEVAQWVVEGKTHLERLREQAANVE